MACACGNKNQQFVALDSSGKTIGTFNTSVEAAAAAKRAGGTHKPK